MKNIPFITNIALFFEETSNIYMFIFNYLLFLTLIRETRNFKIYKFTFQR
ncbi:hypothetical protein SAMN04487893_10531 [Myroides guanonis]|uniref:Uncharacterized protein n=1 Tax=Myroides guanonis TaxID=1150112 RepID=A0A1I3Q4T1_9FLAO|nr:hypothetical protein SAMN04487893_10531 [Myroides guanonis]